MDVHQIYITDVKHTHTRTHKYIHTCLLNNTRLKSSPVHMPMLDSMGCQWKKEHMYRTNTPMIYIITCFPGVSWASAGSILPVPCWFHIPGTYWPRSCVCAGVLLLLHTRGWYPPCNQTTLQSEETGSKWEMLLGKQSKESPILIMSIEEIYMCVYNPWGLDC